jgi:protein required for attachment to host cells
MMTTWIVVCDASRARVFSADERGQPWTLVETFEHPAGRLSSKEIAPSSPPGRVIQNPSGRHTALESHHTPKESEGLRFAELLADHLDQSRTKHQFDDVVLVAPPHFLGVLNAALGRQLTKQVSATIGKDLTMFSDSEVRERLVEAVFPNGR